MKIYERAEYIDIYKKDQPIGNTKERITYKQLIIRFEDVLNKLINALEIYIIKYIEKIDCKILPPDIENEFLKITHLLRIIGQDELIRRTGGVTKTIEFRLQQDMQ